MSIGPSAIVQRLAAPPIAPATETKPQAAPRLFRVDDTALRRLEERFFALHKMSDEPQARGRQQEGKMNEHSVRASVQCR